MTGFSRFGKTWGSLGTKVYATDLEANTGWSYIAEGPPTVEEFNAMFADLDEKDNYLFAHLSALATAAGLSLSSGSVVTLRDAINVLIALETTARVVDVNAEEAARITAVNAEATARFNADVAEANARFNADVNEANVRAAVDGTKVNVNSAFTQLGGGNFFSAPGGGYWGCKFPNGFLIQGGRTEIGHDVPGTGVGGDGSGRVVIQGVFFYPFSGIMGVQCSPTGDGFGSALISTTFDGGSVYGTFGEYHTGYGQNMGMDWVAFGVG